jgi:sulfoxide reductase catalytic subunit YedY
MVIGRPRDIRFSEVTPRATYLKRRDFLRAAAALSIGTAAALSADCAAPPDEGVRGAAGRLRKLTGVQASPLSISEKPTSYDDITSYNNFYETGSYRAGRVDASGLRTTPWTLSIEGLVARPMRVTAEELIASFPLEERIYRHRCVETWSAIVPWIGIPLAEIIRKVEPTSDARFVEFVSLLDPQQLPGQRSPVLQWPYTEGLRLDEAMHPLAILAVGLYGEVLPPQNGAPIHLIVPWKYGFKGAKSIVRIRVVAQQPRNTWQISAPDEYGFYANVNPMVDHPRWSQARERRLGEYMPRETLMFNGYGDQVASLYAGMDLRRNF